MREGTVAGQVACELNGLAVRNGQNSGDQDCPMRYAFWHWYVTPGSRLQAAGNVEFVARGADGSEERVPRSAFRLTGSVKRYEQDQDYFGALLRCTAGDGHQCASRRPQPCRRFDAHLRRSASSQRCALDDGSV
jgi:hypothetical protein